MIQTLDDYRLVLILFILLTVSCHFLWNGKGNLPGPRRFPLLGNIISSKRIWVGLAALSEHHGALLS